MLTITFTPKPSNGFYTLAEINALFTHLEEVLSGKLATDTTILNADLLFIDGGGIVNLANPVAAGDLLPGGV